MTDQPPALRDQIAEALMAWTERNANPQYAALRRSETVRQNAYSRADAVLAVLAHHDRDARPHACGNCEGIDPSSCVANPNRAARQTFPAGPCGCGAPDTPNVIHRQGAPCYMDQDGGLQTVELPTATARQTTGQNDTKPDPTTADDPVPLRWGLGDVLHGDDDSVTVYLSGPDREPYWLELDPDRRDALCNDLAPLETHVVTDDSDDPEHTDDCPGCEDPAVGQPAEAHDTDRAALRERLRLAIAQQYLDDTGSGRTIHELDDTEFGSLADAALSVLTVEDER